MARDLTAALIAAATANAITPILLADFAFDSANLRLWTGIGTLSWDSVNWVGAGDLVSVGEIEETAGLRATGTKFSLNGISASLVSLALTEEYQGRDMTLYFGALNSVGVLVSDPYILFKGFIDTLDLTEDGESATFVMSVENRLVTLERPNTHFYTDERLKVDHPSDRGFEQVNALQELELVWGN